MSKPIVRLVFSVTAILLFPVFFSAGEALYWLYRDDIQFVHEPIALNYDPSLARNVVNITYIGNNSSMDDWRFERADFLRFDSQITVARGTIVADASEYSYYSLMQRVPFCDIYMVKPSVLVVTGEIEDFVFVGQTHRFFGRLNIKVDGTNSAISGEIEPNAQNIVIFLVFAVSFLAPQIISLKRRRSATDMSGC